jgi:FtsH-binding integral membrane protein
MENYSKTITQTVTASLYKTFGWMSFGIGITAITSFLLSQSSFMGYYLHQSGYGTLFRVLIAIAQIALSFSMFFGFKSFSYRQLKILFSAFSAVTGMSLSAFFFFYEMDSIIGVFFITSGMFAALATYGATTKRDLSGLAIFAVMTLTGIFIFSLINLFIRSAIFSNILLLIGIPVFALLTAIDIQKIKNKLAELAYDDEMQKKITIIGAVIMYQNFINLFIRLLILLGKRKKD